jgi:hypothetical protein
MRGHVYRRPVAIVMDQLDLFIVGHPTPEATGQEVVAWLKANYPGVRILALNPPLIRELIGADYNVKLNGPETLLAVIATALGGASATLATS